MRRAAWRVPRGLRGLAMFYRLRAFAQPTRGPERAARERSPLRTRSLHACSRLAPRARAPPPSPKQAPSPRKARARVRATAPSPIARSRARHSARTARTTRRRASRAPWPRDSRRATSSLRHSPRPQLRARHGRPRIPSRFATPRGATLRAPPARLRVPAYVAQTPPRGAATSRGLAPPFAVPTRRQRPPTTPRRGTASVRRERDSPAQVHRPFPCTRARLSHGVPSLARARPAARAAAPPATHRAGSPQPGQPPPEGAGPPRRDEAPRRCGARRPRWRASEASRHERARVFGTPRAAPLGFLPPRPRALQAPRQ